MATSSDTPMIPPNADAVANREFDFWIGQWIVHSPDGSLVGNNRIERAYNGYVIHEHYSTPRGYCGESLNIYDRTRKLWHQTWVDNSGMLLLLEGGMVDGSMLLEGQTIGADGEATRHRIRWTPNADGSVRQLWESAAADGPWITSFDGLYTRA